MNKWNKTGIQAEMTEKLKGIGVELKKIGTDKRIVMTYTKVVDDKFKAGPSVMIIRSSKVPQMRGDIELWLLNPSDPNHGRVIRNYGDDFPWDFDNTVAGWLEDIKNFS